MRGVIRSEPKFLAIVTILNLRRCSVRTKILVDFYQFDCDAFFRQNPNARRYFPIGMRGVLRPEPKRLALVANLNARRFSVRTARPGNVYQSKFEAFLGQNRNS